MSNTEVKWIFAYQAAKRIVFENANLKDYIREDLFSEKEWEEEVNLWIPRIQEWKNFLSKQNYQIGDFVLCAWRMPNSHATNKNCVSLEDWEIEDNYIYPTVDFVGQIKSFYPERHGYFGRWAEFKTFDGEGDCQRRLEDLLIISDKQKDKALKGIITCDELKLPEIKFSYL